MPDLPINQLRTWLRGQIDGAEEVEVPELAALAIETFGADHAFMTGLFESELRQVIYREALQIVASTRRVPFATIGTKIVSRAVLRARQGAIVRRWQSHLEFVGDRHVLALSMTRAQCFEAAKYRGRQAEANARYENLWTAVGRRLDDNQVVGDVFSAVELEAMATAEREEGVA